MKKRILSLVLVMAMLCAFMPCIAQAASSGTCGADGDNVTWTLDDNGTLTISGEGDMMDYVHDYPYYYFAPWHGSHSNITEVLIEQGVTSIGDCAFFECDSLTSVTIPDSVTSIGDKAFDGCYGLTSVTIPNSVTNIGDDAFYQCYSLTSITIPGSVTSIGDDAFCYCRSLTSITIPDSVTFIGNGAFSYCDSLACITLPGGITNIGDEAFYNCTSLTDVYYGGSETQWYEIDIGYYNDCLTDANIHYNSYMKDDGTVGEYEPPVERTISASFSGGYGIVYDADADSYNMSSFTLTAILENLYISGDVYRNDFLAKNVTMNITLPQGFSFAPDSTVSERSYDIGNIDYRIAADDTIYLQKPSAGTATIKVRITGDNVKTADFTYDIVIDRYAFDVDIYRANFLTTSTLGNTMEDTYFNLPKSPSQELHKAGKECGMDGTTGAWKLLMDTMDTLDNPSSIADYVFEEKDMYEAIIMSMFESSVNFKVMSCINNDITKDTRNFENDVTSMMKNMYEYDGFSTLDLTKLSKEEKDNLFKNCDAAFKKAHPNAADIDKMTGFIGKAIDYASDFQTLCEQINAYYNIRQLSGSMQQIMKDMYNVCPSDNPALKQALRDCISVMGTSDDEFTQRMAANVIAMTGKNVAQAGFDELWSGVKRSFKAANPAAYIAQTIYESGKLITQVCFNTDEIQEKYCKIIALVNTENVLNTVYNNTKSSFKSAKSKGNAQAYNSAVDVMFNILNSDCDYATAFADAVDSSLAGQISSLLGDDTIEDFKDSVTSIKTSTDQFHETVLTYWIGELEKEGNDRYKDYEYLLDESWERMRKKYNVACPVDIYIYDTDGVIVGSVIDNVPYCRPDANITISVEGDEKTIYMYGNKQYNISYVGNDAGEMDISIAEYDDTDNVTRNVYFNNIELTDGLTYNSADTGSNTGEDAYILTDENDLDITPGYDSLNDSDGTLYTASIERGCFAEMTSIERELHVGENAEITAYVPNGYKFIGWTTDTGEDIFADAANVTTSICMPDHDIAIIANIEKCPTISISDYTDNRVTVDTLNCEDIRGEVILAVYDETDTLKSVYQKPLDDIVIFENVNISNMNIKVMLWDSMENMKPLAAVVEQTL